MLKFRESESGAKILAEHYAQQIGSDLFANFIMGKVGVASKQEAEEIIKCYWKMVNLSIADNDNNVCIAGAEDAEFWMFKLFNKISGYMVKIGYKDLWEELEHS